MSYGSVENSQWLISCRARRWCLKIGWKNCARIRTFPRRMPTVQMPSGVEHTTSSTGRRVRVCRPFRCLRALSTPAGTVAISRAHRMPTVQMPSGVEHVRTSAVSGPGPACRPFRCLRALSTPDWDPDPQRACGMPTVQMPSGVEHSSPETTRSPPPVCRPFRCLRALSTPASLRPR